VSIIGVVAVEPGSGSVTIDGEVTPVGKYLVMIYDNEAKWAEDDGSVSEENHRRHQAFAKHIHCRR